jgi:hypothetical protein
VSTAMSQWAPRALVHDPLSGGTADTKRSLNALRAPSSTTLTPEAIGRQGHQALPRESTIPCGQTARAVSKLQHFRGSNLLAPSLFRSGDDLSAQDFPATPFPTTSCAIGRLPVPPMELDRRVIRRFV